MPISPIRSPLDMQRAQLRLAALAARDRGGKEELEFAALQDAVEHYRCMTGWTVTPLKAALDRPDAIDLSAQRQPAPSS